MQMKDVDMIKKQLNHRSIRHYKDEPLDAEIIDVLLQVANASATSNGLQSYSMIIVDDPIKKDKLAAIARQDYVRDIPFLVLFVVDAHRNTAILNQHGVMDTTLDSMTVFFQGFSDALIGAQSMVSGAEALDLGTLYIGGVLNDPQALIDMFALPQLTMPILALGIGHPKQIPAIKPKMPLVERVFVNEYQHQSNYKEALQSFNEALKGYVDLRAPNQPGVDFVTRLKKKNASVNQKRDAILSVIQAQGFDINNRKDEI
jgi:nitroreductase